MLDLIVLGQIPGTHLQITFAWYLFAALGVIAYVTHHVKKVNNTEANKPTQLRLFN